MSTSISSEPKLPEPTEIIIPEDRLTYNLRKDIPEGINPRKELAKIAYNLICLITNEFVHALKKQMFAGKTHDGVKQFESNVTSCSLMVDMIMKAENTFKLSDNFEDMKRQVEFFKSQIEDYEKALDNPELPLLKIDTKSLKKELEQASSTLDKISP